MRCVFESMAPKYFIYTVLHHFLRRATFRKMVSRRIRTNVPEIWKFRYMNFRICICSKIMEFDLKSEMGPYGSEWARIKTGRSHVAQDHFRTPPGPKRGYIRLQKIKNLKVAPNQPSTLVIGMLFSSKKSCSSP